jgi:hypothetical protein
MKTDRDGRAGTDGDRHRQSDKQTKNRYDIQLVLPQKGIFVVQFFLRILDINHTTIRLIANRKIGLKENRLREKPTKRKPTKRKPTESMTCCDVTCCDVTMTCCDYDLL